MRSSLASLVSLIFVSLIVLSNNLKNCIAHEQPNLSSYLGLYYDDLHLSCEPVTVESHHEPLPFLSYHIHTLFWPSNNDSVSHSTNLKNAFMESFGIPFGDEGKCQFPGKSSRSRNKEKRQR